MKRNLQFAFLSILVMLLTVVLLVSVSATEYNLKVSSHTVNRGQTVDVKFDLTEPEAAGIRYDVQYDATALTPISFTYEASDGTAVSNIQSPDFDPSAGEFTVVIYDDFKIGDANVTVTFEVADDAEIGTHTISVSVIECKDYTGSSLYPVVSNGVITIAPDYSLNVSSHTVPRGQTVDVTFDLSGRDNVAAIRYDVQYDASVLTPISFATDDNGSSNIQDSDFDPSVGEFTIVIYDTLEIGDATVTFEVADDAELTSYIISVSNIECCDYKGTKLYPEASNGTITVTENYEGADHSGSCGENVKWYLFESTGELLIRGTGDMESVSFVGNAPWYEYRSSIKSVVIEKGVTSLGNLAFEDCINLVDVSIPESVTSIGSMAFFNCSSLTSISIPNSVKSIEAFAFFNCSSLKSVIISENVTSISDGMFSSCTSLTSVTIPVGVTSIGDQAFYGCIGLMSITIPDSVITIESEAFARCKSLTEITIPESVNSIGEDIFYSCDKLEKVYYNSSFSPTDKSFLNIDSIKTVVFGGTIVPDNICSNCTNLENVSIADGVTKIGVAAFAGCKKLTSVKLPDSVTMISGAAFDSCYKLTSINIPDGVTSIGFSAFYSCSSLTNVTIPDSVTLIGNWAFAGCYGLTNITIPDSVTNILEYTFYSCIGLTSVTIPDGVTSIDHYAFKNCTNLSTITIPDSVTSIGGEAFALCSSLKSVTIGNGVTRIGSWAFTECTNLENLSIGNSVTTIDFGAFSSCTSLQSVEIPGSVTIIGHWAFDSCVSLTNVTIPDSVTSIGNNSFSYCSGLTSVAISDSVTSIGNNAFSYCNSLTSVTIPESVTSIGNNAFSYCHGLTSVMISESVTSIGDGAFIGCDNLENATVWENSYAHTHFESDYPNINLNVVAHTTGIYLNYKDLLLKIGSTKALTASVEPCNAYNNNVIWSSSDDSIVSVDENGKITRLAEGTVTITATTEEGGFTASCTLYDYTVSYDTNGGSGEFVEHFKGFNDDVALPLEIPTKSGYTFTGWLGSDGETYAAGDTYSGNADLILTASWKANTYKVTFDARDGEVSTSEITVTYDEVFGTLPVATKENCVFDGWYLDEECTVKVTEETVVKLEKDSVLYASFKPIRIIGDTNCDGKIDTKDVVLLAQHLAKWTVTIDEVAADCNADGKIDTKDVVLLAQHLAKWAVTLG